MKSVIDLKEELAILKQQKENNQTQTDQHFKEIVRLSKLIHTVEINKAAVEAYVDEICQLNKSIKTRKHENYRLTHEIEELTQQLAD